MILSRISQAMTRGFMNRGRQRARQVLLAQNDRLLADNGFSRELLEQGLNAWPWRTEAAIHERYQYWEAQLVDIGISCGTGPDAGMSRYIGDEFSEDIHSGNKRAA